MLTFGADHLGPVAEQALVAGLIDSMMPRSSMVMTASSEASRMARCLDSRGESVSGARPACAR